MAEIIVEESPVFTAVTKFTGAWEMSHSMMLLALLAVRIRFAMLLFISLKSAERIVALSCINLTLSGE